MSGHAEELEVMLWARSLGMQYFAGRATGVFTRLGQGCRWLKDCVLCSPDAQSTDLQTLTPTLVTSGSAGGTCRSLSFSPGPSRALH